MIDILAPHKAAAELGSILRESPEAAERRKAAQGLGRYSAEGSLMSRTLLPGLQDESPEVRAAVYLSLANLNVTLKEALDIFRKIRSRLRTEEDFKAQEAGERALQLIRTAQSMPEEDLQ